MSKYVCIDQNTLSQCPYGQIYRPCLGCYPKLSPVKYSKYKSLMFHNGASDIRKFQNIDFGISMSK